MVLEAYVELAKKDTDESWKKIDSELNELKNKDFKYQASVLKELPSLFEDENGSVRDLAASCLSSLSLYRILNNKYAFTGINVEKKLKKIRNLIRNRPKRGIFDEHPYAQLRAVMVAIDYNWLSRIPWLGGAKEVLEKHKNEDGLEKITKEYLEKGTRLYETI